MALYAIGDVQGCYRELLHLLERIDFQPGRDQLWFTGDLVNRGPDSLAVLRFIRELGAHATVVLGNHDLHLLAIANGVRKHSSKDSLKRLLKAPDSGELIEWLRHRPLLHYDPERNLALVHAGLAPQWDIALAQQCAKEVEAVLKGEKCERFLTKMYGDRPSKWRPTLKRWRRLRFITNCLTRMRFCRNNGALELSAKGPPGSQRKRLRPWFELPDRASRDVTIVTGHWSTLGYYTGENIIAIDTGCLWGGQLSAVRLDGKSAPKRFSVECPRAKKPSRLWSAPAASESAG